jgi:hypothetical protein
MKISWYFLFFFKSSLPNQVEHTWFKPQLHICTYERTKILFVDKVLPQNSNTIELVKFLEKIQKLHIQIVVGHVEDDIM